MKHAILLLSSYGSDYLNKNVEQFENDKDIDIYIHIHKKSLEEKDKIIFNDNIKFCDNIFNTERFSFELAEAMYSLLNIANKNFNYDYYHFFSDHCYITTSLEYFKNFFKENKYTYIWYWDNQHRCYIENKNKEIKYLYKGSQWFSLYKDIANELVEKKDIFNYYKESFYNKKIKISNYDGAMDEMIFQSIIINEIFNGNIKEAEKKIINNDLRYINWDWKINKGKEYRPIVLLKSDLNLYDFKKIKDSLIARKIDYKNKDSWDFLLNIKELNKINYNKKFQIWSISHFSLNELNEKYGFKETENLKLYYTKGNNPGINIDRYNYELSEYTGIYYVWKNKIKSDIVGFCGYRRFFNKNLIDLERINNGEVQTWECPQGFRHPLTNRDNNFIEWCLCFNYNDFMIYKFCESLSKFTNKDINLIFKELTDKNIMSTYPGRHMFICKWEIFEKIMTIYDDFLNRVMPDFDKEDNLKKYIEIQEILLTQKYNIGNLKIHKDQNFCWDDNNKNLWFNKRMLSYYNESFIGAIIQYFFPTFENSVDYYINIDNLTDINNLFRFYNKNLINGVRGFLYYSKNDKHLKYDNNLYYKLGYCSNYDANRIKENEKIYKDNKYYIEKIFIDLYDNKYIVHNKDIYKSF